MKRNVLIFGLVLGVILCVNMVYMVHQCYTNPNFKTNNAVGYLAMLVVYSLVFFGIRNYRNRELNGIVSFKKAFIAGAAITLIGSTMYVVVWLFYYYLFVPDFINKYTAHVLHEAAQNGPADLAAKTKEMKSFGQMYKNPFFVILTTYAEVLPIGLIVALLSALILKRKGESNLAAN